MMMMMMMMISSDNNRKFSVFHSSDLCQQKSLDHCHLHSHSKLDYSYCNSLYYNLPLSQTRQS